MPRKKVVTWGSLIDRFVMEKDIGGLSERTLASYRWTLEKAVDYWGHDSDPLSITEDDIMDLLGRWRRNKNSPTTIANRISCFHTFFRWLSKKYKCRVMAVRDELLGSGAPQFLAYALAALSVRDGELDTWIDEDGERVFRLAESRGEGNG
jgi:site-specific recombinase XerD